MKKLFVAVRQGDLASVSKTLADKPTLLHCTATPPPKKDHGQSLLQVAIKSGNTAIAEYLLTLGADVNFIEDDTVPGLRQPVLLDAITAIIYSLVYRKPVSSERNFLLLLEMLAMNADLEKCNTLGFSAWQHAVHEANFLLKSIEVRIETAEKHAIPCKPEQAKRELEQAKVTIEKLLDTLVKHGANVDKKVTGDENELAFAGLSAHDVFILNLADFVDKKSEHYPIRAILQKYYPE
jgi:ankyrin repeat protein